MNKLMITGNLTRDPDVRVTADGISVTTFTVAVNKRTKKEHPEADYFRVTTWRGLADVMGEYLKKGIKVCVIGAVSASAFIDQQTGDARATLEIKSADDVEILTPKGKGTDGQMVDEQSGYAVTEDEDLPY